MPFCALYKFTGVNMMCIMELLLVLSTNLHTRQLDLDALLSI
jgi:hypothetical protein